MVQLALTLSRESRDTQRSAIYAWLLERGNDGATDADIQAALNLSGDTERPRRLELQAAGKVEDSGRRVKTQYGRQATVWVAV